MAALGAALPYVTAGVSILGTVTQMRGQRQQAQAATQMSAQSAFNERVAAEFEARQAEYLANQAKAVSQREALEQRRVAALTASSALARAAASGAGASDPTVVDIMSNIYAEGAYRSALALYEGEEASRAYTVQAQARRLGGQSAAAARTAEGQSIARASQLNQFSTLLSGAGNVLKIASEFQK